MVELEHRAAVGAPGAVGAEAAGGGAECVEMRHGMGEEVQSFAHPEADVDE